MDEETIAFLRTLCAKVKEAASLCDSYLERISKRKIPQVTEAPANSPPTGNRLIPVAKWNEYLAWPSTGGLRAMIFSSYKSGADYFIRRSGRRLLICEKSFFEWVNMSEDQRIKASPEAMRWKERFKSR